MWAEPTVWNLRFGGGLDKLTCALDIDWGELAAFDSLTDDLMKFSSSGIRPGLERVSRLLSLLGSPERSFKAIQLLGTNGKGSTAATLESVFDASGLKTALYTSPHLVSLQERLRVGKEHISIDKWRLAFGRVAEAVCSDPILCEKRPTFFENLTAMAFLMIADSCVDIAVIEAGMGGRYDATSACDASAVIITPISMDHSEYLGATLEAIASEKFAAVRRGVPAFCSGDNPLLAEQFKEQCRTVGASAYLLNEIASPADIKCTLEGTTFSYSPHSDSLCPLKDIRSPLLGVHQAYNQSNVISFLLTMPQFAHITEAEIREGIARTFWPGRMEVVRCSGSSAVVILDGAHNEQGAGVLAAALSCLISDGVISRTGALVFAVMKDKAVDNMLETLRTLDCPLYLTQLPEERSMRSAELGERARSLSLPVAGTFSEPKDAFKAACAAAKPDEAVVCCGSLHLVGYLKRVLADDR